MKKINLTTIFGIICSILVIISIASLIFSNSVSGFAISNFILPLVFYILGLVLFIGYTALSLKYSRHHIIMASIGLIAIIFISVAYGSLIKSRSSLVATQFTYDKVNMVGWKALISSFVSIGAAIIAIIITIINVFIKEKN